MSERAEFERWAMFDLMAHDFDRGDHDEYLDDFLQQSWLGWQAGRAQQPDTTTLKQRKLALMESDPELFMAIADDGERSDSGEAVAFVFPDDLEKLKITECCVEAYSVEMGHPERGETMPLYAHPAKSQGVPEGWWVSLIDRVVPDLSPEPGQEQYPVEWALWSDRRRIRQEIATAVLCTPQPESDEGRVLGCTHPDCGRFYCHNAKRYTCRARNDDACAIDQPNPPANQEQS